MLVLSECVDGVLVRGDATMIRPGGKIFSLAAMISLGLAVQPAQAQGFLDMLFGGPPKRVRAYSPPAPAKKAVRTSKAKARGGDAVTISAPSYNQYKADPLERVKFAEIAIPPKPVAYNPDVKLKFPDLVGSLSDFDLFAEKRIAAAMINYYSADPDFIWVTDGKPNAKAIDALRVLNDAGSQGLDVDDYRVDEPVLVASAAARDVALMRFEMTLSARVLRYVRDAHAGRIDPNRISGYYDFPAKPLDLPAVLRELDSAADIVSYLDAQHPKNPEYAALRAELASLRASEQEPSIEVDPTLLLRPGESSAELPKLLSLIAKDLDDELGGDFGETIYRHGDSEAYGPDLVPLIKAKQKQAGLKADGVIGPRTVQSLTGVSTKDRINKVLVALEQSRWLPSELGPTRVFINQPAFTASYFEDSQEKLSMRVVVGKVSNQTSFFYDEIEQVDYNPYWGVPQSIIVNEMLPRLRRDPGYLDRAGYEVYNAKGKRVRSSSVSWGAYGAKIPFAVRQTPSEANALGELKILFPNEHAIYMHDTPQKAFFDRENRALSHGCVRLADPRGMAAAVLGKSRDYVAGMLKKGHSVEKVQRKIPVYVAYFTAWPNANGQVEYFGDVYSRDARLLDAIAETDSVREPTS
jgi:murein L,D-transpeptidase YcbB/YkuD